MSLVYRPDHPAANSNGMVEKHIAGEKPTELKRLRGVIQDTMPLTWHPSDGKHYDSKSKFRAVTKAHGALEVGNESVTPRASEPDRTIKADIARSIAELGG